MVFRPRWQRPLFLLSIGFLLVASLAGAVTLLVCNGPSRGWVVVAVFVTFAMFLTRGLDRDSYYIAIHRDRFEYAYWFRKYTLRWNDIAQIRIVRVGLRRCVAVAVVPGYRDAQSPYHVPLANYRDYDFVFPDALMPPEDLLEQLTVYWEDATRLDDTR